MTALAQKRLEREIFAQTAPAEKHETRALGVPVRIGKMRLEAESALFKSGFRRGDGDFLKAADVVARLSKSYNAGPEQVLQEISGHVKAGSGHAESVMDNEAEAAANYAGIKVRERKIEEYLGKMGRVERLAAEDVTLMDRIATVAQDLFVVSYYKWMVGRLEREIERLEDANASLEAKKERAGASLELIAEFENLRARGSPEQRAGASLLERHFADAARES